MSAPSSPAVPAPGRPERRPEVTVRPGTAHDLPAVAAIYTHYVLNTTITFNTSVRTPAQWRDRFDANVASGRYDLLVAERDGVVVGYVETQPFRPKPAYDTSVEVTIYVAPDEQAHGVGTALYDGLLPRVAKRVIHRLYAVIALPNRPSEAFHRKLGFVHRGTLSEAGRKLGRYLDVAFYELALDASGANDEFALDASGANDELALDASDADRSG